MHDPLTVAHEINSPFKNKHGDHNPIITIWHKDPETDGTDDSCGWFIRPRHADKYMLKTIISEFEFNFKHDYWFTHDGIPVFSTQGIVLNMYKAAAWKMFYPNRRKYNRFLRKYLFEILSFAENPTDSLHTSITQEYRYRMIEHDRSQVDSREDRIRQFAAIIYTDILRKERKWYQHPRWHIHHWRIQFHPIQQLIRRYWQKCCVCGKRGFKNDVAFGDCNGRTWHGKCNSKINKSSIDSNLRDSA